VPEGAVLRIERGTTVYGALDTMITVIGRLETFGNDEKLVQFRGWVPTEPWDGVRLENPGELTVTGIDVRGARIGIYIFAGKQTVSDSIAAHNDIGVRIGSPGMSVKSFPVERWLRGCVIAENQGDGIKVVGHRLGLDHCTVADNGATGLLSGYPEIHACVFARNEIGIISATTAPVEIR
jgi:hypothetical protein